MQVTDNIIGRYINKIKEDTAIKIKINSFKADIYNAQEKETIDTFIKAAAEKYLTAAKFKEKGLINGLKNKTAEIAIGEILYKRYFAPSVDYVVEDEIVDILNGSSAFNYMERIDAIVVNHEIAYPKVAEKAIDLLINYNTVEEFPKEKLTIDQVDTRKLSAILAAA
jgi:hypothetical protein